jgi:hypothetical protein
MYLNVTKFHIKGITVFLLRKLRAMSFFFLLLGTASVICMQVVHASSTNLLHVLLSVYTELPRENKLGKLLEDK